MLQFFCLLKTRSNIRSKVPFHQWQKYFVAKAFYQEDTVGKKQDRSSFFLDQTKQAGLRQCIVSQPRQAGRWGSVISLPALKSIKSIMHEKIYFIQGQRGLGHGRCPMILTL